jgi:hypothetical protein
MKTKDKKQTKSTFDLKDHPHLCARDYQSATYFIEAANRQFDNFETIQGERYIRREIWDRAIYWLNGFDVRQQNVNKGLTEKGEKLKNEN